MKFVFLLFFALLLIVGCSSKDGDNESDGGSDGDTDADGDGDTDTDTDADSDTDSDSDGDSDSVGLGDSDDGCASASVSAEIDPVYLAFALDVSGSMGEGDKPWHDRLLKWDPVVAATTAFFMEAQSAGFWASMTFFPSHTGDKCEDETYATPDVDFTPLPSPVLGEALDVMGTLEWAGGTPTVHVMNGVLEFVTNAQEANPGKYAIVLVTDGYPEGCDDDNNIDETVAVAEEAAAQGILTYVIGVNNPPIEGAPDTTSNLAAIGIGGGTGGAFMIDSGDPDQTIAAFEVAMHSISSASFSCSVLIPPPPENQVFDRQKVRVIFTTSAGEEVELKYDPVCADPNGWHYDNPDTPTQIELCSESCSMVQLDSLGVLQVEFGCVDTIILL